MEVKDSSVPNEWVMLGLVAALGAGLSWPRIPGHLDSCLDGRSEVEMQPAGNVYVKPCYVSSSAQQFRICSRLE